MLSMTACTCALAQVQVESVRMWPAPDHTRVVFDITGPVDHTLFQLSDPDRVVVDLRNARFETTVPSPEGQDKFLARIRSAPRNHGDMRVVFDLKRAAQPKSFLLKPNSKYGHRLVIDLREKNGGARSAVKSARSRPAKLRDVVIAIDAGHGGEDPGAIGHQGTFEKNVTLAVAQEVEALINRERGMRPVMIRRGDYYIGLRERTDIARQHRADLFVSIHADAFRDRRARGSSVYVVSRNGASSEAARWLAEQENRADLVGGVSLDDKDELLASVLLDLSQTATLSASVDVADKVLEELRGLGRLRSRRVERAGFVVLKSPDIPSVLVETGFITNPHEERKLRTGRHRKALARAIVKGIHRYFDRNAPPGTLLATREHVITRGETLSGIAQRYRISLDTLRAVNGIHGEHIVEGQILRIPDARGS
ncbi:MAG: AMIN domain-containing protein [Gammaproteobacteria bacterium]|nr:AMIN domain-containing protein [Gammaproteobacteria bacterium]NIR84421.1 AMIN domain-containing protein [Gammaproteobacteria bacterium]NIR90902.1 AMIN domain-containing protein [Gammaproteobacteria bacterium]